MSDSIIDRKEKLNVSVPGGTFEILWRERGDRLFAVEIHNYSDSTIDLAPGDSAALLMNPRSDAFGIIGRDTLESAIQVILKFTT